MLFESKPYRCSACPERHYYGILVAKDQKPPRCPNCRRTVVPVRKDA
jgi:rubrerythrin